MWSSLREPGRLALMAGRAAHLRGLFQELAWEALQEDREAVVLWCDGDHGFNPYDFAELNLTRGLAADDGADRLLVKRCMTPFQWDTVLTRHLDQKLEAADASLVVVNPFDGLWSHEEIQDWEQEDYTRFSLQHLAATARRFDVPVLLGVDMQRWWRTHPTLAEATRAGVDARWSAEWLDGRLRAVRDTGEVVDPLLRRSTTLLDFLEEPLRVAAPILERPAAAGRPPKAGPVGRDGKPTGRWPQGSRIRRFPGAR